MFCIDRPGRPSVVMTSMWPPSSATTASSKRGRDAPADRSRQPPARLAAIAGCSSIDVDTATSRSAEPSAFQVEATGQKVVEENGANRLEDLHLSFRLSFPDDAAGRKAAGMVERLVTLSHDKYCTVSRTVEHGTAVRHDVSVGIDGAADEAR